MDDPLLAVSWPRRTARLSIRRATPTDVDATWAFRQLEEVNRWLTRAPASVEEYRDAFVDPDRLVATLVVELDGLVIGDLMLLMAQVRSQGSSASGAQ